MNIQMDLVNLFNNGNLQEMNHFIDNNVNINNDKPAM